MSLYQSKGIPTSPYKDRIYKISEKLNSIQVI